MMRSIGIAFTAVAISLGVVRVALAGQATRLEVSEVWVADGHTRLADLTRIVGAAESAAGTIWVASPRPPTVLVVDPSGTKADDFVVAREGDGPGELRSVGRIAVTPNGNMAVHDISRNAIEIYTSEGEPIRRVTMPLGVGWIKGFDVLRSGGFVLSGGVMGNNHAIHHFDETGAYVRSWGEPMDAEDMMARFVGTGGALNALPDGSLLYSRAAPHEIIRYEIPPAGNPQGHVFAVLEDVLQAPGDDVIFKGVDEDGVPYTTFRVWYPQSRGVFPMAGGRILNVITHSNENPELRYTLWQLFDSGGGLETEARTAGVMYQPWFECSNGDILATRHDTLGVASLVRLRVSIY